MMNELKKESIIYTVDKNSFFIKNIEELKGKIKE